MSGAKRKSENGSEKEDSGRWAKLDGFKRALAYGFAQFMTDCCSGKFKNGEFFIKENGFRVEEECCNGERSRFSKSGLEIKVADRPRNVMEAIGLYMDTHFPEISVLNFKWDTRVDKIAYEFVARRKGCEDSYLKGLFHKECIDPLTGKLNEEDFTYTPVVFDFTISRNMVQPQYRDRYETIRDSLFDLYSGTDKWCYNCLPGIVEDVEGLLDVFLNEEGVVLHTAAKEVFKIKLPKTVFKGRIIAAANTIQGFNGFTHFLVAVPDENAQWRVIHAFDWTSLFNDFTRPGKGHAFIGMTKVSVVGGRVICTSGSTIAPLVDAVFRAVSGAKMFPPISVTKTTAVARFAGGAPITYKCGPERSFSHTDAQFQYLAEPVPVTFGADEIWELKDGGDVHLQPAWILGLEGFGHPAYREIEDYTPLSTLLSFARERFNPRVMYEHVGMVKGPFLGMEEEFCAKMTIDKFSLPYKGF